MNVITANVPLLGQVYEIEIRGKQIAALRKSRKRTDLYVGPTLFDVQVNGYGGRTCAIQRPEEKAHLAEINKTFRALGIGWWVPTLCTASRESLATSVRLIGEALDEDADLAASVPGLHLEGPYLSPLDGPRGAHSRQHVRNPDWDEFQRLQDLCRGRILYITLAPELPGAIEFIRKAVASGVVVSMGHTNLDRDDLTAAVDAGASMSTHLGNGAHNMIQRHNNYIWYQLACRKTFASFIADGHHLPQECLYSLIHAKGRELSLITSDSVSLAGLKPGIYGEGEEKVELLPSGRINLLGTPNLAGSASNLLQCVENVIRLAQLSHADGWRLASVNAAQAMRLEKRLGIEVGKEASLSVYRYDPTGPRIQVVETWIAGRKVSGAAAA